MTEELSLEWLAQREHIQGSLMDDKRNELTAEVTCHGDRDEDLAGSMSGVDFWLNGR